MNENLDICYMDHSHSRETSKCNYGPTNFPDPRDISEFDKKIFQVKYHQNMTIQDYVNWLWLNQNNTKQLCYEHLKNFDNIKNGIKLIINQIFAPKILNY